MSYNISVGKRFWDKVDIKSPNECWEWTRTLSTEYGRFWLNGKFAKAHRVSWELTNGPIPKGKLCLHKCDNKRCVNPNHLYIGTHCDNMSDLSKDQPNFGYDKTVLHSGEIWLVRKLCIRKPADQCRNGYKEYEIPAHYIAKMFRVSPQTIRTIWNSDKYLCREGIRV